MTIVWCKWLNSLCTLDGQPFWTPHPCTTHSPPPLSLPVNYTTFLCWYFFWVFINFVLFLPLCWLQFHHFIFVVLLWSFYNGNICYTVHCKVPISNITSTHPIPGVAPKYSGTTCLTLIPTKMPPGKSREGKFWAWNLCCIWWDRIPLKVCWPTEWFWWQDPSWPVFFIISELSLNLNLNKKLSISFSPSLHLLISQCICIFSLLFVHRNQPYINIFL